MRRLCRYISRPAVASERLTRAADGRIRYSLKTPYRDGTTHVVFEPLDFLSRLAALVPSPGVAMGWAQRLKRVFGIEMQRCEHCGGAVKIIASIEDPQVIERILAHVEPERLGQRLRAAAARGPPSATIEAFE
jgi:hypothetical protein